MSDKTAALQHLGSVERLDKTIKTLYPELSLEGVISLRDKVIDHIVMSLQEGFTLAYIKRDGDQTILRILKLIEEDDQR